MVYSFDIFDTVVTRAVAHPADAFSLMQEKVTRENFPGLVDQLYCSFRSIRQNAERTARWQRRKEDVGLKDIYETMSRMYHVPSVVVSRLMELELETEIFLIRPIEVVCERARRLISLGEKVIFMSDMYLPADFLQSVLVQFSVASGRENIFVSGDIGVRKITGRLYRYVLKRFNIPAGQLCHFGDHLMGDILIPRLLGISLQ